jgi:hypothetical protein
MAKNSNLKQSKKDAALQQSILQELQNLNKSMQSKPSRRRNNRQDRVSNSLVTNLADALHKVSFSLGIGGARAFAMQRENVVSKTLRALDFNTQLRNFNKELRKSAKNLNVVDKRQMYKDAQETKNFLKMGVKAQAFATTMALTTVALIGFRNVLVNLQHQLGGVGQGQAMRGLAGSFIQSGLSAAGGQFVTPGEIRGAQQAHAQEFGGLLSSGNARQDAAMGMLTGMSRSEISGTKRALQGSGRSTEQVINMFRRAGIVSSVASAELVQNAGAAARAGEDFEDAIVNSVKQSKLLGLSFSKMESTLTGIATDFTGSVRGFAELRSVLPQFSVGLGQLLETSLNGTTEEFVEQIRGGLMSAGITDVSQMSRAQIAVFERATGFGGAELQRIIKGNDMETVNLDQTRNDFLGSLFNASMSIASMSAVSVGLLTIIAAATSKSSGIAGLLPSIGKGAGRLAGVGIGLAGVAHTTQNGMTPMGGLMSIGGGALAGSQFGAAGAGVGAVIGLASFLAASAGHKSLNDFVYRPGRPPIAFSPQDTLIGVKDPSSLGGTSMALEQKVDKMAGMIAEQNAMFSNGVNIHFKDFDRGLIRKREASVRNA